MAVVWRLQRAQVLALWRQRRAARSSYGQPRHRPVHSLGGPLYAGHSQLWECDMGKYVIGWLLGVPAIVLVVVYFFFR